MDFNLALKLYTAEQVKNGEVVAAHMAGVSMYSLMQRAGMVFTNDFFIYTQERKTFLSFVVKATTAAMATCLHPLQSKLS